jgi:hypothetical protein
MRIDELRSLLAGVQPMDGELPAWCATLTFEDLPVGVRWLRARLDQLDGRGAATTLTERLQTYREREAGGSILRPLFDAAIVAVGTARGEDEVRAWVALVDVAEAATPGFPQLRAWLTALTAIAGAADENEPADPGSARPPGTTDEDVTDHASVGTGAHARPHSLEERVRAKVRAASARVKDAAPSGPARWGIDFGTARSKMVLRLGTGTVVEDSPSTRSVPSIVVVERDGDRILFGERAADVRRDAATWNVCTSMKRFLVGRRIDVSGMPLAMTTERLTVLYIAWLLHSGHATTHATESPCDLLAHLSLPLARSGENPELRDTFSAPLTAARIAYRDWLPRAFRLAQLVATTYRDDPWPESVGELLTAVQIWDQMNWAEVRRATHTISEPAAVAGDFEPLNLPAGLTMLVDCGAGTTDVSVFWRNDQHIYKIVEHSAVVGGDVIDEVIEQAVLQRRAGLEPYKSHILNWAREVKPRLLAEGRAELDPELEFDLAGLGTPVRVTLADAKPGVDSLASGVTAVTVEALEGARTALLEAKPRGQRVWPTIADLQRVWFFGGSSAVSEVPLAIDAALERMGVAARAAPLPAPNQYAGWAADRYRLLACAVGASRPDLFQPEDLPVEGPNFLAVGNSPYDKD